MNKRRGTFWITFGLLLIAAAIALSVYNMQEEEQAMEASAETLAYLETVIPETETAPVLPGGSKDPFSEIALYTSVQEVEVPDYLLNPNMDMPVLEYEGNAYIGTLSLPTLGLELPILSQWSDAGSKAAPCRYSGSAYLNDLVIAGHNYTSHFKTLPDISEGDPVIFTDTDGNRFAYEVAAKETLMPTAVEEMTGSDWDLTLFTCTVGGSYRFTVRCALTE